MRLSVGDPVGAVPPQEGRVLGSAGRGSRTGPGVGLAALALVTATPAARAGPGAAAPQPVAEHPAAARALGAGDAACALILPAAADALAADEGEPCADVVTAPDGPLAGLTAAGTEVVVEDVHVAGRQAQVVTATDTVFLALSGDAWVVTAAGCTPRDDRPYDCEVEA